MSLSRHKVFISYHHVNDQYYKETLSAFGEKNDIFIDMSVGIDEIDDNLDDQAIRKKIRDEYIKDASVLILLVGRETKYRKHIDWEIYSSMHDGSVNKKLGILVIQLPSIDPKYFKAPHGILEKNIYSTSSWININSRKEYEDRYPDLPARIIDNLLKPNMKISITRWSDITDNELINKDKLKMLIDLAFKGKLANTYDLSRPMRKHNS